jgi:hypothetical protein
LQQLCDTYGFNFRDLAARDVLIWNRPAEAVTFVENHDVVRDNPIAETPTISQNRRAEDCQPYRNAS